MKNCTFTGPLFIVGVSRSGTKLLRDILNNNKKIFLSISETHFIPTFLNKYQNYQIDVRFKKKIYNELIQSGFYLKMKNHGMTISYSTFCENTEKIATIEGLIEFTVKYFSTNCFGFQSIDPPFIWGDKTPSYSFNMLLLKKHYPNAKFIHLIRDPRDVALSFKKSWGKNLYSSANKWKKTIECTTIQSQKILDDYFEIKYENLIQNSEKSLKLICDFIGCDYSKKMLRIHKSTEFFGTAKNSKKILSNNCDKFKHQLSTIEILKIERICYQLATLKNYKLLYAKKEKRLGRGICFYYKIYDFLKYTLHIIFKERGFKEGSVYLYRSLRKKIFKVITL